MAKVHSPAVAVGGKLERVPGHDLQLDSSAHFSDGAHSEELTALPEAPPNRARRALDGRGRMTTRVLGALGRVSSLQDGQVDVMAGTAYADVLPAKRKGGSKLDPHSSAEAGVRGARQRACLTKEETFYSSSSAARTR